ncbi:MAG TPA: amidohydrolase family protein [Methylomirabilota bacterium]|nr:amidohydrolase family protein [Methylomirabilota bacterium]
MIYPQMDASSSLKNSIEKSEALPGQVARPMAGPVDAHVHIVGTGAGGTGCRLRLRGWRIPFAALLLRHIGLPLASLRGDFDRLYVEQLLRFVRGSSLSQIVILAQEDAYDDQGRRRPDLGTFYVPNDYVLRLSRAHPEFLPAVSIHPARSDALEELERCIAGGAVMMKCLPNCQNIDCNDRRYTRFWERMAEAGLPLLAHTGGEHTLPEIRPDLADPRVLEWPLQCGVTVIAAHCGTKSGPRDPDYFPHFLEMTRKHPRLYGDTSAFTVPIRGRRVPECVRPPLVERMIQGSDFPVPVHGHWIWWRGHLDWESFRRWERHPNVLERDYQFKRAMGFPADSYTRIRDLLPVRRAVA